MKTGMPLIRQQLKLFLGREQYKAELKKLSIAYDDSIRQMTEAITFARTFMQKNPSQFTEPEKKMYEKKLDDTEKLKEKFMTDIEKLISATPTPLKPKPPSPKTKVPSPNASTKKCKGKRKQIIKHHVVGQLVKVVNRI